jgi:DNA polymerase-3 subunit epsilon
MRRIVIDTETTGLSPEDGHRIVEVGCVEMVNDFLTGNVWHKYFNPQRHMPRAAFEVHGLSDEYLADKPLFSEYADDFMDFIKDAELVIHNAAFDIRFLNAELSMLEKPEISMDMVVDTLAMARRKHPGAKSSLDALCKRYGVDNSNREKHGALLDAELLASVYVEMTGGQQASLELASPHGRITKTDNAAKLQEKTIPAVTKPTIVYGVSKKEAASHAGFIKTMGDNCLWKEYYIDLMEK